MLNLARAAYAVMSDPSTLTHERSMGGLERILAHLRKRWFLLGVVAVIILAKTHPFVGAKGGEDVREEGGGAGPLFPHVFRYTFHFHLYMRTV